MDIKRVFLIILDSVGMGPAPDAEAFGDHNPNTLGHIAAETPGFILPIMESLGLGNIEGMVGYAPAEHPAGAFARLHELSAGKTPRSATGRSPASSAPNRSRLIRTASVKIS